MKQLFNVKGESRISWKVEPNVAALTVRYIAPFSFLFDNSVCSCISIRSVKLSYYLLIPATGFLLPATKYRGVFTIEAVKDIQLLERKIKYVPAGLLPNADRLFPVIENSDNMENFNLTIDVEPSVNINADICFDAAVPAGGYTLVLNMGIFYQYGEQWQPYS